MSTAIARPVFTENQILSAADVNAIVSHARGSRARHDRYLHSWGIANGLELVGTPRTDTAGPYVEVTVSPGLAIDGSGREIFVTESVRVSEDVFDQLNITDSANDPTQHFYPVFIVGRDEQGGAAARRTSVCLENPSTRVSESYFITFGSLGSAADLDKQVVPDPDAPVGSGQAPWRILLGFVSWNGTRFVSVRPDDGGFTRRYVGVRAGEVIGLGDSLVLRSAARTVSDKAALVVDNTDGGQMRFGLHDSLGTVVPVFTVNSKGDVIAEGKILGAIAGGVQVESGVITDGLEVPLPAGITQAQVDSGEATLQVQVQPRFQQPASLPPLAAATDHWMMQPLDCRVDGRRVVCLVRWESTSGAPAALVLPGVCDYVVMGFVKSAEGA